jgi:hypothetical protein
MRREQVLYARIFNIGGWVKMEQFHDPPVCRMASEASESVDGHCAGV